MKNLMITGVLATLFLASCSKTDDKVAEKTLEQEKMEYQMRQLDIEKQKLAIEQEKFAYEKQKAEDSIARLNEPAPVVTPRPAVRQAYVAPARRTTTRRTYASAPQRTYSAPAPAPAASTGSNDGYATNTGTQTVQKKKMSNAAKGAIIGTAAGAIGGAVISKKNPGAGAVIGGIVGGATGYTIGKSRDNQQSVYTPSTSY